MNVRTAIFILGMHRSGTSALARLVNLLGASLPRRVLPAGLGNELGHWEPEAAVALHDRMLEAAGTPVNGLSGPPDAWFETPAAEAFLAPMRQLIDTEFAGEPLFVFKDPRTALLFPLWRRVLADLGVRCLPIVMLRDPLEAAASLVDRQAKAVPWQSWSLERAGLLWLRYMLAAERHTRGGIRAFCSYADLLDDWRRVATRLADDLGCAWPRPLAQAAPDIDAFLDAGHRHQRAEQVRAGRGGVWSFWIAPAFEALSHAGARTGAEPEQAVLDTIGQSFADVCAAVQPIAEPADPVIVGLPAATPAPAVAGQRGLCLVVTAFMLDAARTGELAGMLGALRGCDTSVTLVSAGAFPEAASRALASIATEHGVELQPCAESALPIEPTFLKTTVELFRHLRARQFEAVLFPDREGPGYASIVAKQAGLALATTKLGVIAFGTARSQRERERRFPGDLVTLSVEHIEQKAVEGADVVRQPSQAVGPWMHDAAQRVADAGPPASITVVISHFERPHLLDQNLQALTRQTDRDFSVLVVDDGSQGADAIEYLEGVEEAYRQLNLRLVRQANQYLGAARNAGIRAAATEFVILLDDDNLAFPTLVATLRQAVCALQADVVTCGIRHFHDAEGTPDAAGARPGPDQFFAGGPLLVGAVHNCFGDASGIYRRGVFDRVGYFHEQRGVTYEDWQMHLRVAAAGLRLVSLPEALVWYRVRTDSMLRTTHRHDNARVIASTVREMPCSALEPLADFLIGQEEERVRLNLNIEAMRAAAAAHAAALGETGIEASRHALALEQMLETRTKDARTAERYAQSLEEALAEARTARDAAAEYARSLESARAAAEAYARELEAELARRDREAAPEPPRPSG